MAAGLNRLTIATVKSSPPGKIADVGGLYLNKFGTGRAQWVFRYTLYGRRHEMGLGSYPGTSRKKAREHSANWRGVVNSGRDAIRERERARFEAERNLNTLQSIALDTFESKKADLKGNGKAGRWFSPLELHVLPKLGSMPVSLINQRDIRDALLPIWHTKSETARKALNRLNICIRHAAALGLDVDVQAVEKAKLLLGKQRHSVKNVPSMHWREAPRFYQTLDGGTVTELALRMLILTVVRSFAIRRMRLDEIKGDVWTVPAESMKGRIGQTNTHV